MLQDSVAAHEFHFVINKTRNFGFGLVGHPPCSTKLTYVAMIYFPS